MNKGPLGKKGFGHATRAASPFHKVDFGAGHRPRVLRAMRCRMCGARVVRLDACLLMDQRGICLDCHEAIHPGKEDSSP